ncbi:MAG: EamA family transporter [Bacteroidales bacterium]
MWILYVLISSFLLGIYDIFKKLSLQNNWVISVLFTSSLVSAFIFIALILVSRLIAPFSNYRNFYIPPQNLHEHMVYFAKTILVGSSWLFAYYSIKHLPVTLVSAIRSSSPIWTLLGAILIFNEKLNFFQWAGIIITVFFYYHFSKFGQQEGIKLRGNKWVIFSVLATLLGSISALFDKYLVIHYNRMAMQAWFAIYMPVFLLPFLLLENKFFTLSGTKFKWRSSILFIGISLVMADFVYFLALSQTGAMISMVSALRRTSVVFTFFMAGLILKEKNIAKKMLVLAGILSGIGLIIFGSAK